MEEIKIPFMLGEMLKFFFSVHDLSVVKKNHFAIYYSTCFKPNPSIIMYLKEYLTVVQRRGGEEELLIPLIV